MKISLVSITTLLLAAVAGAQKPVSADEQRGWYGCTAALLDKFEKGSDGSRSACDLWSCLHLMSTRYQRGGGITTLSSALDPICWGTNLGSNLLPKWDFLQSEASLIEDGRTTPGVSHHQGEQQATPASNVKDGKLIVLGDTADLIIR